MHPDVEQGRIRTGYYGSSPGYPCGAFKIPYRTYDLWTIVSDGSEDGWEHVSVSLKNRLPNWEEMSFIKNLFWDEEECVLQFHPPKSQYINNHPFCLHLWKHIGHDIELPPSSMVGFKELNV
jgi:hypothetical protein